MILICCVDERNGMSFEGRRTSQDRIMRDDLRQLFPALTMDAYAYSLFSQDDVDYCYEICEDLTQCSYPCLVELLPPSQFEPHLEKVVLYQWHRQYPHRAAFLTAMPGRQRQSPEDFGQTDGHRGH